RPDLPERVGQVVLGALAKEPWRRPARAGIFAAELLAAATRGRRRAASSDASVGRLTSERTAPPIGAGTFPSVPPPPPRAPPPPVPQPDAMPTAGAPPPPPSIGPPIAPWTEAEPTLSPVEIEAAQPPVTADEGKRLASTVFAPPEVESGETIFVQVFAHL